MQVLLLQRNRTIDFVPGANVFPGGRIDDGDQRTTAAANGQTAKTELPSCCDSTTDLAFRIGAIRECFEECGLLLAHGSDDQYLNLHQDDNAATYAQLRQQLLQGTITFNTICQQQGLQPAVDNLYFYSHWITPVGLPKRYDTRFYITTAPTLQTASHDNGETVAHTWISPSDALEKHQRGDFELAFATRTLLKQLANYSCTAALIDTACQITSISAITPQISQNQHGRIVLLPGDDGYIP